MAVMCPHHHTRRRREYTTPSAEQQAQVCVIQACPMPDPFACANRDKGDHRVECRKAAALPYPFEEVAVNVC